MEICQSCGARIIAEPVPTGSTSLVKSITVDFTVFGGIMRRWGLCEPCTDKLQDLVLGFMGELPPGDEPEPEDHRCDTCFFITPGVFTGCARWEECINKPPSGSHWKPRKEDDGSEVQETADIEELEETVGDGDIATSPAYACFRGHLNIYAEAVVLDENEESAPSIDRIIEVLMAGLDGEWSLSDKVLRDCAERIAENLELGET